MVKEKINSMIEKLQGILSDAERLECKSVFSAGTVINKTMTEMAKECKSVKADVSAIRAKIKESRAAAKKGE